MALLSDCSAVRCVCCDYLTKDQKRWVLLSSLGVTEQVHPTTRMFSGRYATSYRYTIIDANKGHWRVRVVNIPSWAVVRAKFCTGLARRSIKLTRSEGATRQAHYSFDHSLSHTRHLLSRFATKVINPISNLVTDARLGTSG